MSRNYIFHNPDSILFVISSMQSTQLCKTYIRDLNVNINEYQKTLGLVKIS